MTEQKHTPPWVADPIDDANGFTTIRIADGSLNGNTEEQPIATVYDEENATFIVRAVNSHYELLAICKDILERGYEMSQQTALKAAIAKAEGK